MKEENENKQQRKKYAERGTRGQKMMNFRADWDTIGILNKVENKGRLLNTLVKDWARRNKTWPDVDPEENDGHDVEP